MMRRALMRPQGGAPVMAKPGPLLVRWEQHTRENEISTPMMKAASTMPAATHEHHICASCTGAPYEALLAV